jgi:hypothetical protein
MDLVGDFVLEDERRRRGDMVLHDLDCVLLEVEYLDVSNQGGGRSKSDVLGFREAHSRFGVYEVGG